MRAIRWTRRRSGDAAESCTTLALFNEVVAAVQNPAGDAPQKNVLLQLTEAKRWDVTYGFGFEAQTGTPQHGHDFGGIGDTAGAESECDQLTQEGKTGVSPRVSLDVSPDQSARDGGFADAAYDVWIAGTDGDADASESAPSWETRTLAHRSRVATRICRTSRRSRPLHCRGLPNNAEVQADGDVYLRLSIQPGGGKSEYAAGFSEPDSVAVAAGARGWAGDDVVP